MTDYSLLQDFIVETVEHLEEMEGNLLRLEANPDRRETLDDIFRSAHTIKGAAEYLGLEGLAELSHKLENLLDRLRRDEIRVDRDAIDLLMAVRDRMGLLIDDLEASQTEQTVFADLVERLQAVKPAVPPRAAEPAGPPADAGPPPPLPEGANDSDYEEEFDEELFAIFLEQLTDGLTNLQTLTRALQTADRDDQAAILDSCVKRIDPLRASANYMGYDKLADLYDGWSESIRNARDRLTAGDRQFMPDFIRDYMQANIAAVVGRFPRLTLDEEAVAARASGDATDTATPRDEPAPAGETPAEDLLDVYAATATPAADVIVAPPEEEADLFARLSRSFDNGRQQGGAPARTAASVEIAAELFSAEDDPAAAGDRTADDQAERAAVSTVDNASVELAPAGDPDGHPPAAEAPPVTDESDMTVDAAPETVPTSPSPEIPKAPPENDDYREEYDEELFGIFLEQLAESLGAIRSLTEALSDAAADERIAVLDACLTHIDPLRSSANYMGYTELTSLYDDWTADIQAMRERLASGHEEDLDAFIRATMTPGIAAVAGRFPQIDIPAAAVAVPVAIATEEGSAEVLNDDAGQDEAELPATDDTASAAVSDMITPDEDAGAPAPVANDIENSLLNDFLVETVEHLDEMENSLLHLEKAPGDQGTLDDIFRSVHTIKGAAEYLGMARIADLSHQLENLLDALRKNECAADDDTIDLLIAARDRIGLLTEDLQQNGQENTPIDDLLAHIRRLPVGVDDAGQQPTASEPPSSLLDLETDELEIPLFADVVEETPASVPFAAASSAAEGDAAAPTGADSDAGASADGDRRDHERPGRRQSDRIGERILKQSIRVDAAKIDALMNQVGELVVSRAWFAQLFSEMRDLQQNLKQRFKLDTREMKQVKGLTFRLSEATVALGRVANELQEGVMKVRMLPIAQLFNRYPRLVFDLVRDTDKQVELDIRGEDTELDKMVIEEISDPLIHIIRNAVDHGVETVAERRRLDKPATATIRLEAYHEGNHVVIEIADDGRGLDLERIRAKALAGDFATREELDRMAPKELTGLIMQPGFSTADKVTHTSGRGVGMDVVKKNIEKLNGTIEIDTTPGAATRFRIKIPLTLAIIPALLIKVRQELFTIPLATVEETLRIAEGDISTIEGVEVLQLRESTLPLVRLDNLFNVQAPAPNERAFVVVVSTGMKRVGLVVDELLGQEEVVIKPLEDYLQERSGFSGATILGDGRISLILDVYELVNLSIDREAQKKAKVAAL